MTLIEPGAVDEAERIAVAWSLAHGLVKAKPKSRRRRATWDDTGLGLHTAGLGPGLNPAWPYLAYIKAAG